MNSGRSKGQWTVLVAVLLITVMSAGCGVCTFEDLHRRFQSTRERFKELRDLVLRLRGVTTIRGIRYIRDLGQSTSTAYVLLDEKVDKLPFDMAVETRFRELRGDLHRMKALMDMIDVHSANVSEGGLFMAWVPPGECGYVHLGERPPFVSRRGSQLIAGEEKWYAFRDR